ncbi:MAG: HAD family hydrolase [Promethearchaeota archaeon]
MKSRILSCKCFIFDMDGTLLDSTEAHYRAWDRVTREHGFNYKRPEITRHFGKTTHDIARALFDKSEEDFILSVSKKKADYFLEELPSAVLIEGSREVLTALKARDKIICIASSNIKKALFRVIETFNLKKLIDVVVGLDDIKKGKPDPEIIIRCTTMAGVKPEECIVVGDSIYDMQAAKAAGCYVVGVLTGASSRSDLLNNGANFILHSVKEIIEYI